MAYDINLETVINIILHCVFWKITTDKHHTQQQRKRLVFDKIQCYQPQQNRTSSKDSPHAWSKLKWKMSLVTYYCYIVASSIVWQQPLKWFLSPERSFWSSESRGHFSVVTIQILIVGVIVIWIIDRKIRFIIDEMLTVWAWRSAFDGLWGDTNIGPIGAVWHRDVLSTTFRILRFDSEGADLGPSDKWPIRTVDNWQILCPSWGAVCNRTRTSIVSRNDGQWSSEGSVDFGRN